MITIIYNNILQKYAIYNNSKKVIVSNYSNNPNNTLAMLGLSTTNIKEIEISTDSDFPNVHLDISESTSNNDNLENAINSISFKDSPSKTLLKSKLELMNIDVPETILNELIADINNPGINSKIYVDDFNGLFTTIKGGQGTIKMVYLTGHDIITGTEEVENPDFDDNYDEPDFEDYDDNEEFITINKTEPNILIELEEAPGMYFSWTLIKDEQDILSSKHFGHTVTVTQ